MLLLRSAALIPSRHHILTNSLSLTRSLAHSLTRLLAHSLARHVPPFARAVAQATVYRTGKQAPSVALISYTVVPGDETTSGMPRYAAPQIAEVAPQATQSYVHQHPIALQLSSIATDASAKNEFVSLRMLGPFTAIIGCPVGFVGAAESKDALMAAPPVPAVIVQGRLGGSAITVAAINALASRKE